MSGPSRGGRAAQAAGLTMILRTGRTGPPGSRAWTMGRARCSVWVMTHSRFSRAALLSGLLTVSGTALQAEEIPTELPIRVALAGEVLEGFRMRRT